MALLDRAREVLNQGAGGGHVPKNAEVVLSALGDLLEHRDPVRKAEKETGVGSSSLEEFAPGRTAPKIFYREFVAPTELKHPASRGVKRNRVA